jgi:hypothetical protein
MRLLFWLEERVKQKREIMLQDDGDDRFDAFDHPVKYFAR